MDFSRPDNARIINKLKVLNALRHGEFSRAELSRELVINKVSISEISETLINQDLVEEGKKDNNTSGRPSIKLKIKKMRGRVFSLVFSSSTVTVSASDLCGNILRFERFLKDETMTENIASFINKMTQDNPTVYGMTIVSEEEIDIPKDTFAWPFTYEDKAFCYARAEEEKKEEENCLYISLSDTIEACYKNRFLSYIPTFGHIKVSNDTECFCGGTGCLNAFTSGLVLKNKSGINQYRKLITLERGLKEIYNVQPYLVLAIAEAVQANNAEKVVLCGELSLIDDSFYFLLNNQLKEILPPLRRNVEVVRNKNGDKGLLMGAGIIALDKFFYHTEILKELERIQANSSSLL